MYDIEYGEKLDIIVRAIGVPVGGVLLYLYTGWLSVVLWVLAYAALHAAHFWLLRLSIALRNPTRRHVAVGAALFVFVHASFLWLPAYLASLDEPGLMLIGMFVIVATAMFFVRRSDTIGWLVTSQIAVFSIIVVFVSGTHVMRIDEPLVQAGLIFTSVMTAVYIALTLRSGHERQVRLLEGAERLAQEQKMSAIGRLAGGVAHDFNNALTVIKGNVELQQYVKDPAERDEVLFQALSAATRAEGVIQQLLVFARRAPSTKRFLDANDVLEDTIELAEPMVPERIHFKSEQDAPGSKIYVDDRQFSAALLNLVKNATDAIVGNGTIAIRLSAVEALDPNLQFIGDRPADGRYVLVTVTDTGSGIPDQEVALVTEPFFTTKPQGKGTGLGLSMVVGFLAEHSGGLCIQSSNAGTEISLFLPLANDLAEPTSPQRSARVEMIG